MEQVEVLVATYNGEKYIARQLESIINQTYSDFICMIHDDGSTDSTKSIVNEYAQKYPNIVRILEYPSTGGACNNFLSMLKFCTAKYICFADQDDVWLPNKIETLVADMKKYEKEKPCVVFSNLIIVDDKMNIISDNYMDYCGFDTHDLNKKRFLMGNIAPGCSMIINRELKELAIKYKDINNIDMHDWWCIELASFVGSVHYEPKALILYCQHNTNVVGAIKNNSFLIRVLRNLKLLCNGTIKKNKEQWITSVINQAKELNDVLQSIGIIDSDIYELSVIRENSRINRKIQFIKKDWGEKKMRLWTAFWI